MLGCDGVDRENFVLNHVFVQDFFCFVGEVFVFILHEGDGIFNFVFDIRLDVFDLREELVADAVTEVVGLGICGILVVGLVISLEEFQNLGGGEGENGADNAFSFAGINGAQTPGATAS